MNRANARYVGIVGVAIGEEFLGHFAAEQVPLLPV